ncbi:MAG: hypothetical protein DI609_00800 [Corynebacterium urealyticum]|uniref:Chitin-binding type-3 domain-containing protein n=1 Tax=Corynebacterium urealyticum TaxID=43771 RepID=A0A2W5BCH0_9CORY|nr:MAG: hypothetical protein DI609_00800 [Corynebacterium urealyticum]
MATLEDAKAICREIPEEDLRRLSTWITLEERPRRREERRIADAEAELVAQLQEQHPELAPKYTTQLDEVGTLADLLAKLSEWVQPTSKATSYPPMSLVKHQEKAYRARRLTDKEPGTPFSGWEDVTADFLRPEPIADGNDPEVGTDAPGLITEPDEPEKVTPAPMAQPWKAGEWYSAGALALDNGVAYVSQRLHRATNTNRPSTGAKEWQPLPA